MLDLLLMRHAETDSNLERRLQGSLDPPLNTYGREQAIMKSKELLKHNIDILISSPLRRAYETASIIAVELNLEVIQMTEFRERNYGCLEGLTEADIDIYYPNVKNRRLKKQIYASPNSAESIFDLSFRVRQGLELLYYNYSGKTVLMITHGFVARVVYGMLLRVTDDKMFSYVLGNCQMERYALTSSLFSR